MKLLVRNLMSAALMECCYPEIVDRVIGNFRFDMAVNSAVADLMAFSEKDPASHGHAGDIALGYSSYKAVLHYRLAHMMIELADLDGDPQRELANAVLLISSRGKLLSGAEIHARSKIGKRFVLDHGYGTVIGETAQIGDDCYILGGVVLGATGISTNPMGKRHPTLGNRVEIGAFARVFGDVVIGDDVFIAPNCVIKENISAGSIVTLRSELQMTKRRPLPDILEVPVDWQ
ncbi:serine O-acetyltransferase [Pseudomonas chlororaphis]|uniref:serine O-acetyltransferase n=1 Tax=Pseudomonas chlororaphis TaxID=587753 RepID=UPI002366BFE3|nr:serine O-acetyltransferase [Pseudomonas chlororaphis]WDH20430.1 serine O-acetyltransferase [Pseudomonas chlororaphis]